MRGRRRMKTVPTTGAMQQQQYHAGGLHNNIGYDGDEMIQSRWSSSNTNCTTMTRKRIRSTFISSSNNNNIMSGGISFWLPMALLSIFSVGTSAREQQLLQKQESQCSRSLKNFDIDRDGCLTSSEYVDAISSILSDDDVILDRYFSKLPLHLQEIFDSLSKSSTTTLDGGTITPCIDINEPSGFILNTICNDLNQFTWTKMSKPRASSSSSSISSSSSSKALLDGRIQQQQQWIVATEPYPPLHREVHAILPTSIPQQQPEQSQQQQQQHRKKQLQKKRRLHAMEPKIMFDRQDDEGDCDSTNSIPVTQCRAALVVSDIDRDDRLNNDEYVTFVNRLNGNNAFKDDNYDDLPGNLQHVYQKFSGGDGLLDITGSKPGQVATREQNLFIEQICCEADLAADNPGDPFPTDSPVIMPLTTESPVDDGGDDGNINCEETVRRTQCNAFLSYADISRDNLVDEVEYLRFIQRLSGNQYTDVPFDQLPCNLIQNYEKFATAAGGQIDITGGKPGQTATPEQDDHLDALCCETDLAVQNPGTCQPSTGGPPTVAPEPSAPVPSMAPISVPSNCLTSMTISDLNRDDYLSEEEYVRFLNRLFSNEFAGQNFDDLSSSLQCNYENLADPIRGEIDVSGSKPGQSPNDEHLNEICVSTVEASTSNSNACDTGTSNPASQPTEAPEQQTLPPTFADTFCRVAISSSDFNRDDYLNEDEYFHVLNRLTRNDFIDESFGTLEYPLPQSFNCLTDESGQIFIFGAKVGQNADQDQEDFIIEICLIISFALVGELAPACVGGPTLVPEPTPVPEPTIPPGVSEVYNSFVFSNSPGIDAEQFEGEMDFDELNLAYGIFAERATNELIEREPESILRLRRRRLEVSYMNSSESIYQLVDSECPESASEVDSCLTAYASFQVTIDTEDPDEVSAFYTSQTQALIADGLLQQVLDERDPEGSLNVVNASFPVRPPTTAPVGTPVPSISPAPTNTNTSMPSLQPSISLSPTNSSMPSLQPSISLSPTIPNGTETEPPVDSPTGGTGGGGEDDEEEKSGGSGAVIGAVIGVLLVLAVAGYFAYKRFGLPPCPSIARVGPKKPGSGSDFKGSDRDGESDNGRDGAFTMDNIFSSSPEKTSPNPFGIDNDDKDNDDKDNETKETNNAFGDPGGFGFGDSGPKEDKPANDAFGDGNAFGGLETPQDTNNTFDSFGKETNNNFFGTDAFGSPKPASNTKKGEASNIFDNGTTSPGWFGSNAFGDGGGGAGGANNDDQSQSSGSGSISDVEEDSQRSGDGSYRSSQGSRSYLSGEDSQGSRSYYSDEGSRSGSQSGSHSGSRRSGDESYSQGSRSQDGSQTYNEEDTYRDEDGTYGEEGGSQGSRSYYSNEQGSQGSRSYYSGSQRSGSYSRRSGSYPSQEGSQTFNEDDTFRDDDGTYGEEGGSHGSRSYYSNEEGSQGSRSHYSDEEGSQGSRSHYSDEEGSQGSRSYNSNEEEGSQGSRSDYSDEE